MGEGGMKATRDSEPEVARAQAFCGFCPPRDASGLQAAKRKKRCRRKQTRLTRRHPSGANTDPYLKTGILGSATRATSKEPPTSPHAGDHPRFSQACRRRRLKRTNLRNHLPKFARCDHFYFVERDKGDDVFIPRNQIFRLRIDCRRDHSQVIRITNDNFRHRRDQSAGCSVGD